MGEVVTPYHTLKLGMATERHRLEQVKDTARKLLPDDLCLFPHRQEVKEEMKHNLIIFLLKHSPFYSSILAFWSNKLLLIGALLPAGGGERLCDGEVGSENNDRGQNHRNNSGIFTKELKHRMLHIWGRLQCFWSVLLTCDHPQSHMEDDEEKAEMEADTFNPGQSHHSRPHLMVYRVQRAAGNTRDTWTFNPQQYHQKMVETLDRNQVVPALMCTDTRGRWKRPARVSAILL